MVLSVIAIGGLFVTLSPVVAFAAEKCGGVDTAIIKCGQTGGGGIETTGVWGILLLAVNILTAGVGIVAIGGIVYGAILYTSAAGSAEQVKKAIGIITNVVIGIVAYAVMYSLLNFLVPGGLFN